MEVGGQRHAPAALPPGKTRYPLYRRLCGPQDRYRRVRKISPLPGFDPRTVQSVASHYINWAIPAAITRPWVFLQTCRNTSMKPCRSQRRNASNYGVAEISVRHFTSLLSLQPQMGRVPKSRVMDESVRSAGRKAIDRWRRKCLQNNISDWTLSTYLTQNAPAFNLGLHGKKLNANRRSYGKETSLNGTKSSLAHYNFSAIEKRNENYTLNFHRNLLELHRF